MKITFEDIIFEYDSVFNWAKRMIDHYSIDYLKGVLEGAYRISSNVLEMYKDDYDEFANIKIDETFSLCEFDCSINIDDPGQCYVFEINDKHFGLGTYNTNIWPEIAFIVLTEYHNKKANELSILKK